MSRARVAPKLPRSRLALIALGTIAQEPLPTDNSKRGRKQKQDSNWLRKAMETAAKKWMTWPIVVVGAVEKSTDVTVPAQRCPADPDRSTTIRLLDRCLR